METQSESMTFHISILLSWSHNELTMPIVAPLTHTRTKEIQELVKFFNETLGFCPNSVLTMQRKPGLAEAFVNLNKAVMKNDSEITLSLIHI